MIRVGICGVPGSGKSTLARSLASKFSVNVELVQEYARTYISKHGKIESIFEQYRILEKQVEFEDSLSSDKMDLLITDSPVFLGFLYCYDLPKTNSKEVMFFNDIFKKMIKLNYPTPRYDLIFHLGLDLKPVDDGIRPPQHFDDDWRIKADIMIKATMEIFRPRSFYEIRLKDLDERAEFCINKIKEVLNT